MQRPLENLSCHGSNSWTYSLVPQDLTGRITKCDNQYCAGGSFGDVYRCKYHHGDYGVKEVAVKTFRFEFTLADEDGKDDRSTRMIRRELGIWKRLNHPNIVPFLGIVSGFGRLGNTSLVSAWMSNGTLQNFLQNYDDRLTVAHRLQLLLDIANGLEYLHSLSIVHGDLTPNNVLLDDQYTARLTDFGYASLVGEVSEALAYLQASTLRSGAVRWTAPECVSPHPEEKSHCTTKSDIYSFGNMALQVLSGKRPWSDIRRDEAIIFQLFKGHRPRRPSFRPIDDQHWVFIENYFLRTYPLTQPFCSTLVSSEQNTSRSILGQPDDSGVAPSSSSSPFFASRSHLHLYSNPYPSPQADPIDHQNFTKTTAFGRGDNLTDSRSNDQRKGRLSTSEFTPFLHTPSCNESYQNPPYSGHSELSYDPDAPENIGDGLDSLAVRDEEYDPSEYDLPNSSGLLVFDEEFMTNHTSHRGLSTLGPQVHPNGTNTNFLFPIVSPGTRSKSDTDSPLRPQFSYPSLMRSQTLTSIVIPPLAPGANATASPPIKFDHTGEYAGFVNHSPHRVMYKNKLYPTALHLLEAMKYTHQPALQEWIRTCKDVHEMYPLSASFQVHVRPEWGRVFLKAMEDVLYLKFKQHPILRTLLLRTGLADIIYSDEDTYWGDALTGEGANELGKALVRLRERLRQDGEN